MIKQNLGIFVDVISNNKKKKKRELFSPNPQV